GFCRPQFSSGSYCESEISARARRGTPSLEKYVKLSFSELMTDLNEWKSPQWNWTQGGRPLPDVSSWPGSEGSISMSWSSLLVCVVTALPSAVVSKVRLSARLPEPAPW